MPPPIDHSQIIEKALAITVRVAREGGIGRVEIPDAETGYLATVEIDQARARETLCWLLDSITGDLWKKIRHGQPLTQSDRHLLNEWTAATVAESAAAENEHRVESNKRRSHLYLVRND